MKSHAPSLDILETLIRTSRHPDRPGLVVDYVSECKRKATGRTPEVQRRIYMRCYSLLKETFCDTELPTHWRYYSLDNLIYPLLSMQQLTASPEEKREVTKLYNELQALSHFFETRSQNY